MELSLRSKRCHGGNFLQLSLIQNENLKSTKNRSVFSCKKDYVKKIIEKSSPGTTETIPKLEADAASLGKKQGLE
ncbi:hypothetical protein TNIN_97561, partial [Trichonephila inaurata madagascariensis]